MPKGAYFSLFFMRLKPHPTDEDQSVGAPVSPLLLPLIADSGDHGDLSLFALFLLAIRWQFRR